MNVEEIRQAHWNLYRQGLLGEFGVYRDGGEYRVGPSRRGRHLLGHSDIAKLLRAAEAESE